MTRRSKMSYLNKYQWELIPENLPMVKRSCPKCNEKTNYINSEKFRINANKNIIDVWLIYKCEKCKSTWNMTIYERVKPCNISKTEYDKFLSNDRELAREYAFDSSIYSKNKPIAKEYIKSDDILRNLVGKFKCQYTGGEFTISMEHNELYVDRLWAQEYKRKKFKLAYIEESDEMITFACEVCDGKFIFTKHHDDSIRDALYIYDVFSLPYNKVE